MKPRFWNTSWSAANIFQNRGLFQYRGPHFGRNLWKMSRVNILYCFYATTFRDFQKNFDKKSNCQFIHKFHFQATIFLRMKSVWIISEKNDNFFKKWGKINIFGENLLKQYSKIEVSMFQNRGDLCNKNSCCSKSIPKSSIPK